MVDIVCSREVHEAHEDALVNQSVIRVAEVSVAPRQLLRQLVLRQKKSCRFSEIWLSNMTFIFLLMKFTESSVMMVPNIFL